MVRSLAERIKGLFRKRDATEARVDEGALYFENSVDQIVNYQLGKEYHPTLLMLQPVPRVKCDLKCGGCPRTVLVLPLIDRDPDVTANFMRTIFHIDEDTISAYLEKISSPDDLGAFLEGCMSKLPDAYKRMKSARDRDFPTVLNTGLSVLKELSDEERLWGAAIVMEAVRDFFSAPPVLEIEDYRRILDEAVELKIDWVEILGEGEPFFEPELTLELLEMIKARGFKGRVITNATLIDDSIASRLVDMRLDEIKISMDAPDRDTMDKFTHTPGAYDMFIKGMENLRRAKESRGLGPEDPPALTFYTLLNRYSLDIMPILKTAEKYGVVEVDILKPWIFGKMTERFMPSSQEVSDFMAKVDEFTEWASSRGIRFWVHGTDHFKAPTFTYPFRKVDPDNRKGAGDILGAWCYEPWITILINPDGSVFPCRCFGNTLSFNPLGNIRESSLEEIYNGPMEKMRRDMIENRITEECRMCPPWYLGLRDIFTARIKEKLEVDE